MPRDLPNVLVYGAAMTGGALIALAAHIVLSALGLDLGGLWRQPAAGPGQLRWALAWWLIAGAGFFASRLTVGMLRANPERRGLSAGQWALAGLVVIVLASAGRGSTGGSLGVAQAMLASLAAMALGTTTAALGSYFALRR
jgi:hypothetical protein